MTMSRSNSSSSNSSEAVVEKIVLGPREKVVVVKTIVVISLAQRGLPDPKIQDQTDTRKAGSYEHRQPVTTKATDCYKACPIITLVVISLLI